MNQWSLDSWKKYPCPQAIPYPDVKAYEAVCQTLATSPPLIPTNEIIALREDLARVAEGRAFVIQAGDCAESFQNIAPERTSALLDLFYRMHSLLEQSLTIPVICIGRIAGQFTKPRTERTETHDHTTLLRYHGDMIHDIAFNAKARTPDPFRMMQAYTASQKTIADIRNTARAYPNMRFYTSHEALHLPYEQALTRQTPEGKWFNQSTHFPWIGMRTAHPDYAPTECLRGVNNPLGIKISAQCDLKVLTQLLLRLNPERVQGKIVLITRLGAQATSTVLPAIIESVRAIRMPVIWFCDPMHGNTLLTDDGIKTRNFDTILTEIHNTVHMHRTMHSILGGIHLELTPENVTECLGGPQAITSKDLGRTYTTRMDPRLNGTQACTLIKQLSHIMQQHAIPATCCE